MNLMTTTEAMDYLKVSRTFLWRMIKDGKLHPQYPGGDPDGHPRFLKTEIEALFRSPEPKSDPSAE